MALNLDKMFATAEKYGEPALTVGSSLLSEPVAGWAGMLSGNPDNVENVHHALTYMPRTEQGQQGLANMGEFLGDVGGDVMDTPYLGKAISHFGESADQLGEYSPVLGAALKTAPAALALLAAPEARAAMGTVGGEVGGAIRSGGNIGRAAMGQGQKGAINPAVFTAPFKTGSHAARNMLRDAASFSAATGERSAARLGKGLETTHKAVIAEKTASGNGEHKKGRNLLAH